MKKRKIALGIALVIATLATGWLAPLFFSAWQSHRFTRTYHGDGAPIDLTWWLARLLPVPGYGIRFPSMTLDQPKDLQFTLGELPAKSLLVLFVAEGKDFERRFSPDAARKDLSATLRIAIVDDTGIQVYGYEKPIHDLWWAITEDGGVGFYDEQSRFTPEKGNSYRIIVRFSGDTLLTGTQGHLYLRHGGSI